MANNPDGLNRAKNESEPLLAGMLPTYGNSIFPGIIYAELASEYQDQNEHIDVVAKILAPDGIAHTDIYIDNKDKERFDTPNYSIKNDELTYIRSCKEHNPFWYEHHYLSFRLVDGNKLIDEFLIVSTKDLYENYANGSLKSIDKGSYHLFDITDLRKLKSAKVLKRHEL